MIPIECPDCHSSDWDYLVDPVQHSRMRAVMAVIREESDVQTDFNIVKIGCKECNNQFWVSENQAQEHVETFL